MSVVAPPQDPAGAAIDAAIAAQQALISTTQNLAVQAQYLLELNQLQVQAVEHYMVTGWLNAATILETYQPPPSDKVGQALVARVSFLTELVANAPPPPPGNADGYGSAGWVTVLQNYQAQLYAAQITLVEHIMDLPAGTPAATMLATLTGFQSFVFEYSFTGVGYTDAWIDD